MWLISIIQSSEILVWLVIVIACLVLLIKRVIINRKLASGGRKRVNVTVIRF